MSDNAATTKLETRAAHMSSKYAHTKSETEVAPTQFDLFLDQLKVDVIGTIVVMINRMWDVNAVTKRYLSTDFVVSDAKVNEYHESVASYITNIGRTNHQNSSSKTLDFYLANQRLIPFTTAFAPVPHSSLCDNFLFYETMDSQ
nr:hypothetical protein [Tanacetum cinerariifolium]